MAAPVVVTSIALAAFNFGLALLIVAAMGARTFAPPWLGAVALLAGAACAVLAVRLWRQLFRRNRLANPRHVSDRD